MDVWDEFLLKREKVRALGVADDVRRMLEEMGPVAAIPVMDELLRTDRAAVAKLNAAIYATASGS